MIPILISDIDSTCLTFQALTMSNSQLLYTALAYNTG
jgi:hypothetical protein